MNGHRPIFFGSWRSETRRADIVRSLDGTWTAFARIWWWLCDFLTSKTSDFNGDRAGTILAPDGARRGTAQCKMIAKVLGGACTVTVQAPDVPCFVGRRLAYTCIYSITFSLNCYCNHLRLLRGNHPVPARWPPSDSHIVTRSQSGALNSLFFFIWLLLDSMPHKQNNIRINRAAPFRFQKSPMTYCSLKSDGALFNDLGIQYDTVLGQ